MTVCAINGCHSASAKHNKHCNITFHVFPSDPIISALWTEKVRLSQYCKYKYDSWKPTKNTKICSLHFDDKEKYVTKGGLCRLQRGAVPHKNVPNFFWEEELKNVLCDDVLHHEPNQPKPGTSGNDTNKRSNLDTPTTSISISTSIFDTLKNASLRRKLNKKILLQQKQSRKIKTLRQKTRRLKKINASFKNILINLEKERYTRVVSKTGEQRKQDNPSKKTAAEKAQSSQQKAPITLSDDDASQAKSEPGWSPGVPSDSDSDDELLKPKEEVDSDKEESEEGKTFSFQSHYLYRNAVNLVASPTGAAVVDSSSSKSCVVPDCLSKSRRLFDLPRTSEARGAWLELLPWLPDGTGVAEVVLCSRHFSPDYLTPAGLHMDALPTMNLPDPLSDAWPAQEGKTISNDVVTTSVKLRELGETSSRTLTKSVNASTVDAYRNDLAAGQADSKGFGQMGSNMQPQIHVGTLPVLRSNDGTDLSIKIEPELQENPSLYLLSITPAPNIKVQSFFEDAAIVDYMQPNTSTTSYPVGPNLNVSGLNNLSFVVQPMEAKPAICSSWEVPLTVTNSQATTSMGPPGIKSKLAVIKKVSQTNESETSKRVKIKKRKAPSIEGDDSADVSDGLEIGEVRITTPVTKKAAKIVKADDISAPCILCEDKCKYKMTMSCHDLKDKIFKCFGIELIANHKFEMCEGCLSQLKNAEYFRTKVHIVNEQIIKDDIMNRKVGDPPLETEEPVKPVIQLSEKETQTNEALEIYNSKDLSNFRILFDEEVDPRNLLDSPSFLRMSSDIYRDGLSLCKKRILIMTEKQQPSKLTPLENATFPQKVPPPYDNSEYQNFQSAFESAYKKPDLPPPLAPMVGDMYKGDTPAVNYALKKFQPFFGLEKKVIPPPLPPPPKPKKAHIKPIQVEKPLIYTEGRPPTRMGRKLNLTKEYVCKICYETFLEIQLLKTHIEGHKAAGEQKSNIPAPASRPNPNLYNPGPSREFGHIDHHR